MDCPFRFPNLSNPAPMHMRARPKDQRQSGGPSSGLAQSELTGAAQASNGVSMAPTRDTRGLIWTFLFMYPPHLAAISRKHLSNEQRRRFKRSPILCQRLVFVIVGVRFRWIFLLIILWSLALWAGVAQTSRIIFGCLANLRLNWIRTVKSAMMAYLSFPRYQAKGGLPTQNRPKPAAGQKQQLDNCGCVGHGTFTQHVLQCSFLCSPNVVLGIRFSTILGEGATSRVFARGQAFESE